MIYNRSLLTIQTKNPPDVPRDAAKLERLLKTKTEGRSNADGRHTKVSFRD
jgi:hypothetical protein